MNLPVLPRTDSEHANDPLWLQICDEVRELIKVEPMLTDFLTVTILNHSSLESALSAHLGQQIDCASVPARVLCHVISDAFATRDDIRSAMRTDLTAVFDRDSACESLHLPLLYFKGFHALQLHRVANWLWSQNRRSLALLMQSRASMKFGVDIHPAARFGVGIMLDHATGLVVGETAVVGNQVSILQSVTLGGTGKEHGDRHPKIGDGHREPGQGILRRRGRALPAQRIFGRIRLRDEFRRPHVPGTGFGRGDSGRSVHQLLRFDPHA